MKMWEIILLTILLAGLIFLFVWIDSLAYSQILHIL